jgi:hypothetical protein
MATATWTWLETATGYAASDGRGQLVRVGRKAWKLVLRNGTELAMPRRASFDHAEHLLAQHGDN